MTISDIVFFVAGLAMLLVGGNLLVRGASDLAATFGVPPLIVGLTVVSVGTSAPELAVSVQSALEGETGLAVGNAIGSSIFNVLFILGLTAVIARLVVQDQLVRVDVPVMIGVTVLLLLLALDGDLSRLEGGLLVGGLVGYVLFQVWAGLRESAEVDPDDERADDLRPQERKVGIRGLLIDIGSVLAGFALLIVGARWLVDSATRMAQAFGVSDLIIGLTVVAVGTSMPEIVTSVAAVISGKRDIAVGNVVGSNIFNILGVLGVTSIVAQGGIEFTPGTLNFDLPVLIAVSIATLPIFLSECSIERWEGGLFLGYYGAYTLYLFLNATQHRALEPFNLVMLLFVLPLTAVTLAVIMLRTVRSQTTVGEAD